MPVTPNIDECGWFYHAPAKREFREKQEAPAPSQIPGIGYNDPEMLEKQKLQEIVFKETDSKFIRMAKLGGRKDLLCFNPTQFKPRVRSGRRCQERADWFYLEDNKLEDQQKREEESKQWEFLLPDYMVHQAYQPSFSDPDVEATRHSAKSAPFHVDKSNVLEREGRSASDKRVKIPEVRKEGYGVRTERPPPKMQKQPAMEKPIRPPESELGGIRRNKSTFSIPGEREEPTQMSKLLGNGYERDWYNTRAEHQGLNIGKTKRHETQHNPSEENQSSQASVSQHNGAGDGVYKKYRDIPPKVDSHQTRTE